jgi:hypothetical protein
MLHELPGCTAFPDKNGNQNKTTTIAVVEEECCVAIQGRRLGLTVGLESVNWEVRCGVVLPALAEEKEAVP